MQQDIQNHPPNSSPSPQLADIIRDNLHYQLEQSHKRTLLKESLLKISLDKDFHDLFQAQPLNFNTTNTSTCKGNYASVGVEIRQVCQWLEESQDFAGLAYFPFGSLGKLVNLIHQKIQGTAIVLTAYPMHWITLMEDLCRLASLKWGVLYSGQQNQDKVRVLQLFELKKLKILFLSPALLSSQQYHTFQCDLLMIPDMHLYFNRSQLITRAVNRCNPNRLLGLYHTLIPSRYQQIGKQLKMCLVNSSRSIGHNMIVLRTNSQQKFKTMQTYLSRNDYKRILILVNSRQQASNLNKKLLLQSKTSLNLFDYMPASQMRALSPQQMLNQLQRQHQQQKMAQLTKRISNCQITLSLPMDFLKQSPFDIVIAYSFMDVSRFVQSVFPTKQKLLLFCENDYNQYRNHITSNLTTLPQLQRSVMMAVQKPLKTLQTKKRSYSQCVDDRLLQPYTLSKQLAQKNQQKAIRIHYFCRKHDITPKLFNKMISVLQSSGNISINYRTISQIQVDVDCVARMKKQLPGVQEVRRRVNLLNTSTHMEKTVRGVLDQLDKQGIRYKMTQQVIQFRINTNYQDINWQNLLSMVNNPIMSQAYQVDSSFQTFKQCAYSSIELTRRQKALQKKQVLLNFKPSLVEQSGASSYHKSNLMTSQIEEWIRHSQEMSLSQHEMVLLLQGVEKGRVGRCRDDPIFGRYKKMRYEELMETLARIFGNKKVKTQ